MKSNKLHYIIDGYNVLKQVNYITGIKLTNGRTGFVKFLERRMPHQRITLVFDGGPGLEEKIYYSFINIKFSRQISADDLILKIVKDYKKKQEIVVVTDDRELVESLRKFKVRIKKVDEFLKKCYNKPEILKDNFKKPDIFSTQGRKITDYFYRKLIEEKSNESKG